MKGTHTRDDRKQLGPAVATDREFATGVRPAIAIVNARRERSSKLESGVHGEPVSMGSW